MRLRRCVFIVLAIMVSVAAVLPAGALVKTAAIHDIRPGASVTRMTWLSEYFPALADTPGDTPVYIIEGKNPGPTGLILGGTHGDEIAGAMCATLLIEKARVESGRLIVIPRANNSASTNSHPQLPNKIELKTSSGARYFAYGSRRTHPSHQVQDPAEYVHVTTGQRMAGDEGRNLNRVYPGKADGTLTEQVGYAIMQLIAREKPDISIDLHEAGPGSTLAYMIIANPKCMDIAAMASLGSTGQGVPMQLDQSSTARGLSHREWGDLTATKPFIIETANPGQGTQVFTGVDLVNDRQNPLWYRVGVHLLVIRELFAAHADLGGQPLVFTNTPTLEELKKNGLGFYLN